MYFWRIDRLKVDLATGGLSQSEQLKYVVAEVALAGLATIPLLEPNWFDVLGALLGVVIMVGGTFYVYRCNGGAAGDDFIVRYTSLGLVAFLRFVVLVLLPVLAAYLVVMELTLGVSDETSLSEVLLTAATLFVYFFLLGRHVAELRRPAI